MYWNLEFELDSLINKKLRQNAVFTKGWIPVDSSLQSQRNQHSLGVPTFRTLESYWCLHSKSSVLQDAWLDLLQNFLIANTLRTLIHSHSDEIIILKSTSVAWQGMGLEEPTQISIHTPAADPSRTFLFPHPLFQQVQARNLIFFRMTTF